MNAASVYSWLTETAASPDADSFDLHVLACVIALAADESRSTGRPLTECLGLPADELAKLTTHFFPFAAFLFARTPIVAGIERAEDENCLMDMLRQCSTGRTLLQAQLAAIIARRAQQPNHMWQDLGLRNRDELSQLMQRHFAPLAARNKNDMKWKKFFYRTICRDANYSLCTAPSCAECDDFAACFGDESGESLLAHIRRDADRRL